MSDMKEAGDKAKDAEKVEFGSLEKTDMGESMRQLWWTLGVTLLGIALVAYFTL